MYSENAQWEHLFFMYFDELGGSPNAKICVGDNNMLVSKTARICLTQNAKSKICISPNTNPQRESVEYRLRWVHNAKFCVGHVDFMLFIQFFSR